MLKTFARFVLFAFAAPLFAATSASAAMQMPASAPTLTSEVQATRVTFWARPYPYRYVPRHRCPVVRVETPYGWYWDRVCVTLREPVLRRAY